MLIYRVPQQNWIVEELVPKLVHDIKSCVCELLV